MHQSCFLLWLRLKFISKCVHDCISDGVLQLIRDAQPTHSLPIRHLRPRHEDHPDVEVILASDETRSWAEKIARAAELLADPEQDPADEFHLEASSAGEGADALLTYLMYCHALGRDQLPCIRNSALKACVDDQCTDPAHTVVRGILDPASLLRLSTTWIEL